MIVPGSANSLLLAQGASTGYNLTKSLRFRSSASAYMNRTPASAGNRQTATFSWWMKRGSVATDQAVFSLGAYPANLFEILFLSDNTLYIQNTPNSTTRDLFLQTTQVFRDPSAWYHFILAIDTTQATSSNRAKLYVNGVQVTSFQSPSYPSQNTNLNMNTAVATQIGRRADGNYYQDAYLTEFNFIDGQQLTPSSFGENNATTGVWQPKAYTGTYGTNGFYLPFTDTTSTTTLGYDSSGNGNNWTTNNFSLTAGSTYDSMTDVPTLTSATTANYCVVNPLTPSSSAITNGNLTMGYNSNSASQIGTVAVSSAKWYFETTITSQNTSQLIVGVANSSFIPSTSTVGANANGWGLIVQNNANNGQAYHNGSVTSSYTTFTAGDVVMVAYDLTNGYLWFGKNGTWLNSGVPASGTGYIYSGVTGTIFPAFTNNDTSGGVLNINFGQQPFAYTPPTGYVALNTYNLPTSTIVKGNTVMDATLFTSTGSAQTITNAAGFKPDFIWQKARSEADANGLIDSVRGVNKIIYSNLTNAEATATNAVNSFNSNGFTGGGDAIATNGNTVVAWQWQAGQGTTSSNTNGSITSTVSVNATAGFSIVKWTALASGSGTVGHGLGVTPSLMFWKSTNSGDNWTIYHQSLGVNQYIFLNTTAGAVSSSGVWGTINSTTFNAITGTNCGANNNYVSYCWAEIAGFSKFGSYTGNGSTDGPFIYLGFRPKFVMIKRTDSSTGADWWMMDSSRSTYNVVASQLCADLSHAEFPYTMLDFVSNGIKLRDTDVSWNASGGTYIYAAFAENPFKNALAR